MNENIRVLIVDDREENLFALRKVLKSIDVVIDEANSGNKALLAVLKHRYALILLDVQMPEMNGHEVAEILKEDDKTKDIPIVFLTAIDRDDSHVMNGYKTGAIDYIFKPINPDILLSKVKIFIELFESKFFLQRAVDREVASLKEAYEKLKVAKQKEEVANLAKSEFLANMSHEIRTPMHAILGFSKSALKDLTLENIQNKKLIKKVTRIREGGERLMSLLDNLLDLSKLEAGEMDLKKNNNDILKSIKSVVDEFQVMLIESNLQINVRFENERSIAYFDSYKIQQVIRNLISNAIKFSTSKSTICVTVDSTSRDQNGYLRVSITNIGIEIPKEELGSIFDKFFQSSNTKSGAGGTGLGLPICRKMIESHDGEIWAEAAKDGETRFVFILPINKIKKYILVVDDNEETREILLKTIVKEGLEVISVNDGKLDLTELYGHRYSALLVNLSMEGVDVLDLATVLKKKYPLLKIGLISGDNEHVIPNEKISTLGKVEFIERPIDSKKVVDFLLTNAA